MKKVVFVGMAFLFFVVLFNFFQLSKVYCTMPLDVKTVDDVIALFPQTPAQLAATTHKALQESQQGLHSLLEISSDKRTYANTVAALDSAAGWLMQWNAVIHMMEMVHPDEALRIAARDNALKIADFYVDAFSNNVHVYKALQAYAERGYVQEKESLTDEQIYYFDQVMRSFERNGLNLPEEDQQSIKALQKELVDITMQFSANINNDTRTIAVAEKDLAGVVPDFVASLARDEHGNCILQSDTPTFIQIAENCTVEATRQAHWKLMMSKAWPVNEAVLKKMIELRDALAKKLGFASYAHFEADAGMVKTPERVQEFLRDIEEKALAKQAQEVATWGITTMYPWNFAFTKARYKKEHLAIDEQKIAEYFPVDHTLEQLLALYEQFMNIRFEQLPEVHAFWHEDVRLIAVKHLDGTLIGYLLLDIYPRAHKYGHACQETFVPAVRNSDGSLRPCLAIVVANFPKALPGAPALLQRSDVVTFFHEFGHALHAMLGATYLLGTSGTSVKLDFVEMPSQMLEEWMFEPSILQRVSKHYKTGESLPDDVCAALQKMHTFDGGTWISRQIMFTYESLLFFLDGKKDTGAISRELYKRYAPHLLWSDDNHFECSFGHLGGYGSRYYSYLWAKVYALDLFATIKRAGLTNSEIGKKYVETILAPGGSKDPYQLLQDFLGREPRVDAFFESLGL